MCRESISNDLSTLRSRFDVFDALRSTPNGKPSLVGELAVSRSTVDRAIRELEDAGFVIRDGSQYRATCYGELLASRYEAFLEEARKVADAGSLLAALDSAAPMDPDFFADAEVIRAGPPAAHRPIDRFERRIGEADRIYGLIRTISHSSTRELVQQYAETGLDGEFVITPRLADWLVEHRFDSTRALVDADIDLYEIETLPYALVVLEELDDVDALATCFVYGDGSELLGTIETSDPEAVDWALETYGRFRDRASTVTDRFREG